MPLADRRQRLLARQLAFVVDRHVEIGIVVGHPFGRRAGDHGGARIGQPGVRREDLPAQAQQVFALRRSLPLHAFLLDRFTWTPRRALLQCASPTLRDGAASIISAHARSFRFAAQCRRSSPLAIFAAAPVAWGQVYKCTDASGKTTYSDAACDAAGKPLKLPEDPKHEHHEPAHVRAAAGRNAPARRRKRARRASGVAPKPRSMRSRGRRWRSATPSAAWASRARGPSRRPQLGSRFPVRHFRRRARAPTFPIV